MIDYTKTSDGLFAYRRPRASVKRQLRSILWIKYKIKDNEVFEKAYKYIEMYY